MTDQDASARRHPSHEMHRNSLLAFAQLDPGRKAMVYQIVKWHHPEPVTDRQVAEELVHLGVVPSLDPNSARPRCTELIKSGDLMETGAITCPVTGKRVRTIGLAPGV